MLLKSGCAFSVKYKGAEHLLSSYFNLMPCHTTYAGNWIGVPVYQNNLLTSFHGRCRMEIYFSHWTRLEVEVFLCIQRSQKIATSKKHSSKRVNQSEKCEGMLKKKKKTNSYLSGRHRKLHLSIIKKKWYTFSKAHTPSFILP